MVQRIFTVVIFLGLVASMDAQRTVIYEEPYTPKRDAFGRLRVSEPQSLHDAQFTYNLQPLLYDTITMGANSTVEYDSTNSAALIKLDGADSTDIAGMQSFEFFRYQPGKSQNALITFNMHGATSGSRKVVGYSDGNNGIEFLIDDGTPKVRILSTTEQGNQEVPQEDWNIDPMMEDKNANDVFLDFTKAQILVIDFEALYVGRVRIGFDIEGITYYVHEFKNANFVEVPYIANANLPIRATIEAVDSPVIDSMHFICSAVMSEAGQEESFFFKFNADTVVTAGNGTRTHLMSIQPRLTYNGKVNRASYAIYEINLLVTGSDPVKWELVAGQSLTSTSTIDVNTEYSVVEEVYGTLSGDPAIILDSGFIPASNQNKGASRDNEEAKLPFTLRYDGTQRDLGRVSLLVTGLGGASQVYGSITWKEVR